MIPWPPDAVVEAARTVAGWVNSVNMYLTPGQRDDLVERIARHTEAALARVTAERNAFEEAMRDNQAEIVRLAKLLTK